jgi:predicted secreted Zn-dependent protease
MVLFLALLAASFLGWPAAGADEEPTQAGWLCQLAFDRGLPADPADPARFDGAIGSCASAVEFAAAAAAVPDALGDADPIEFMVARCSDGDAGLDRYQSCASIADLLDEPAVDPPPAPEALADRVVIDDAAGGLHFDEADPLYVPVPPGITAHIPGAWKVEYFTVKGNNLKQLDRSVRRQSKKVCGDHAWGCVTNRRVAVPRGRTLSDGARCWVSSIDWRLYKPIVWMPRWKTDALVHRDILRWWTAELARTAAHEAEHIKIDNKYRTWIQQKVVVGRPCGAMRRAFAKLDRKLEKAHRQFHQREDLRERVPWPQIPAGQRQSIKP